MSFICDRCHVQQPPRSKPILVVIETRLKHYKARYEKGFKVDAGGSGMETVREENLCTGCASRVKSRFIIPE